MTQTILEKDITKTLGLDTLSDEEKIIFLTQIGGAVMESSLLRLISSLTEEQATSLEYYLDTKPEAAVLMKHLLEHYKDFESLLKEEIIAFKEDALAVLGDKDM